MNDETAWEAHARLARLWRDRGLPHQAARAAADHGIVEEDAAFAFFRAWTPKARIGMLGPVTVAGALAALAQRNPTFLPGAVDLQGALARRDEAKAVKDRAEAAYIAACAEYRRAEMDARAAQAAAEIRRAMDEPTPERATRASRQARDMLALERREAGATFRAIGEEFGVSVERARQMVAKGQRIRLTGPVRPR